MDLNKELKKIFFKSKFRYIVTILSIIITSFTATIPVYIIKDLADYNDLSTSLFIKMALILIATGIVDFLFLTILTINYVTASLTVILDLVRLLLSHIMKVTWLKISQVKLGSLVSIFEKDAGTLSAMISGILVYCLQYIFQIIFLGISLFMMDVQIAIIIVLTIPVMSLLVHWSSNRIKLALKVRNESGDHYNQVKMDIVLGLKDLKLMNANDRMMEIIDQKIKKVINSHTQHRLFESITNNSIILCSAISSAIILYVGGIKVQKGLMTMGALLGAFTVIYKIYAPIKGLLTMYIGFNEVTVSKRRIEENLLMLDEEEEGVINTPIDEIMSIECKGLKLSIEDREILKGMDLRIDAPGNYAIVGESGNGKSTMINILSKLYTGYEGNLWVNGVEVKDISSKEIRKQIMMIPQEPYFFSDTILNNLKLAVPEMSDEEIIEFADHHGIGKILEAKSESYDTRIGQGNQFLSRGEAQRLALIRALIRHPNVLVLDEASNSIDPANEQFYNDLIEEMSQKKIVINISHEFLKVKRCKKIFFIKDGKITESGDHDTLMNLKGDYYKMNCSAHGIKNNEKRSE